MPTRRSGPAGSRAGCICRASAQLGSLSRTALLVALVLAAVATAIIAKSAADYGECRRQSQPLLGHSFSPALVHARAVPDTEPALTSLNIVKALSVPSALGAVVSVPTSPYTPGSAAIAWKSPFTRDSPTSGKSHDMFDGTGTGVGVGTGVAVGTGVGVGVGLGLGVGGGVTASPTEIGASGVHGTSKVFRLPSESG